ncbi:hypothetical protein [Frankia sp. AiPa1]|uniref:hypothetical protein n=1 Tax=Frankia sp. AiPa1 TaxID=573492 RepID=UPI00202B7D89|nr:hypothetical protein [Frankia sp. AiPa1]MCL9758642.1 hypothetical protein [Frankia sp. AiPa1]
MSQAVMLRVGMRFTFDGEVVEVVQVEGARLTVRDAQDRWRTVGLAAFVARAVAMAPTTNLLRVALGWRRCRTPSGGR